MKRVSFFQCIIDNKKNYYICIRKAKEIGCGSLKIFGRLAQLVQSIPTSSREGHWLK